MTKVWGDKKDDTALSTMFNDMNERLQNEDKTDVDQEIEGITTKSFTYIDIDGLVSLAHDVRFGTTPTIDCV